MGWDAQQNTYVDFGDGINGARLPTGNNNVVATYRIEAGADSPPAGKLTVIAQSYPGLQSVVNPVPVSGGSDPDPVPVRTVSKAIADWVGRLGRVWIEGQLTEISRRLGT